MTDLREEIENIIREVEQRAYVDGMNSESTGDLVPGAIDRILRIPQIALGLAAQMPHIPPDRVGEIMRELQRNPEKAPPRR